MYTLSKNKLLRSRYIRLLPASILMIYFISCDDFVEVEPPKTQLTAPLVFEDVATANAAMTNVYAKMRNGGLLTGGVDGLSNLMGNYADELDFYGNPANSAYLFHSNAVLPTTRLVSEWWNLSYNQIYDANAVFEGVTTTLNMEQADKNRLTGEALFCRAILHFYLTNVFGDIPYVTKTDYRENSEIQKAPQAEVLEKIKNDLQQAINLLPEAYYTTERVRPNKAAAHAILARVELYLGDWTSAEEHASAVINNTSFQLDSTPQTTFQINSPSTIWQFSPSVAGGNTIEATTFYFTAAPPPGSALSSSLIEVFEPDDLRKVYWTHPVSNTSGTWYAAAKYQQNQNTGTSLEYSKVLRLSEQYLIRAEARARQGELTNARQDLNIIRAVAGLDPSAAASQNEILLAILKERQVELFTEFGHRFFDLRRLGLLDEVLAPIKTGWEPFERLLPLPQTELILNSNIAPQNPGY